MIGFVYTRWGLYGTGEAPRIAPTLYPVLYRGMVIIPLNATTAFHIHHWILCLPLAIQTKFHIARGFACVMVCQGLLYMDRFQVLEHNPYTSTM